MNRLDEAADLLEGGFCTGDLAQPDGKHCSVGAILAVNGVSEEELILESLTGHSSTDPYIVADKFPETKVLAEYIVQSGYWKNEDVTSGWVMAENDFASGNYSDVVYVWNDDHTAEDVEEIVETFRKAAKNLDA